MDSKTMRVLGALFVLVPAAWTATSKVIYLYQEWARLQARVERLERWRCSMGSKPQGSTEWEATDWKRECPARDMVR